MVCGVKNGGKDITYKLCNQSFLIFSLGAILAKCQNIYYVSDTILAIQENL